MHRFRIKSKKRKRKFTCTAEHKYNKYLKFSAKKANLLSDEVAEYVSSLSLAMNAYQSEQAIVKLESWLNRIYHELYGRELNAAPSEDTLPSIIGKLTSINLTFLHVKKTMETAVNLVCECRSTFFT